jgi:endogenous inhibitor of DNA gyrase (YacG/DUF329 family)
MNRTCEFCGKLLEGKQRKFCSVNCKQRDYNLKHFERDKIKRRIWAKDWYQKNKEKQNKNVLNYYYKNKEICAERKKTDRHKDEIFSILPSVCATCGKKEAKIIHHKKYGHFPEWITGIGRKNNQQIRKDYYEKYLLLFCSQQCHVDYERKLRYKNI